MKRIIPFIITAVLAATGGWFAARRFPNTVRMSGNGLAEKTVSNQCPMHPWVKSDQPGDCTICGMSLVPISSGVKNPVHTADGIVMLSPGSPNVISVQTTEVKKQRLARTLRVAGMIGEDESRHGVISAPVEGRIDGLAMNHHGQPVSKRQPIATIFSRTLLDAADEYKLALSEGGPALEKARRKLEQCGLVAEQIQAIPQRQPDDPYFGILSPLTGTIVKGYVNEGQFVREGDRLFEVADFTRMWCMFTVYEKDLPLVHERQVVRVRAESLPGEVINARVNFVSPNLDEETRSAHIRVVLENPERKLKNGTFAEGDIELDETEVLAVPRSAVLWPGGAPRVFVQHAQRAYERREVKLGRCGDALWEVLGGLKEGEQVVTSGNILLDGQAQLDDAAHNSAAQPKP